MSDKSDDILQLTDIPAPDDNARKTALNLASAEFAAYQNEKSEKKSQGIHFLSRLMSMNNSQNRRSNMKTRKFIYGGMATAMVVVLAGGAALYQTRTHELVTGVSQRDAYSALTVPEMLAANTMDESSLTIGISSLSNKAADTEVSATISGDSAIPPPSAPATLKLQEEESRERWQGQATAQAAAPQALSDMASNYATGAATSSIALVPAKEMIMQDGLYPIPEPIEYKPILPADNDKFEAHEISPVKLVAQEPVSTFSIDVDTASYAFVRRQLQHGYLPAPDAVRIEEMINYFPYHYAGPEGKTTPFKATTTVIDSPWKPGNKLIHIGIKGYNIDKDIHTRPRANLVFLIDVSGSMSDADKLPLLKNSFRLLLNTLDPEDTVSIVTYAGAAGVVLPPTKVAEKEKIAMAMFTLSPGGSTAGAAGIQGAYALAEQNFDKEAVNRILLATDGDFNVGMSSDEELKKLIEEKRKSGIFLSVLGFGQGNLNDSLMQTLAQNGNGIAAHIDSLSEAQKVLVDEATSSLFPIAKDVKIQVEFNPNIVSEYRLIGYETRALNREDFNNDKVDAGDIGAGHTVTAIYEITPKGSDSALYGDSRYEKVEKTTAQTDFGNEYAFLKMRYKLPDEDTSHLITTPITTANQVDTLSPRRPDTCGPTQDCASSSSDDVRFSIAVAGFGQLLKNDKYLGADFGYENVLTLAQDGKGDDPYGYRSEFINLVRLAETLDQNQ